MNNRVVVITGATGVLGKLTAHHFAAQGDSLALLSNDRGQLESLASELNLPSDRILIQVVDLLDAGVTRQAADVVLEKYKHVDVLIHLVGGWTGGKTITEAGAEDLTFMLNQHAWTTFHLFQAFTPGLASSREGRVLAITSPVTLNPAPKLGMFSAAKAAQENLVLTLAEELRETGVTANVIQVKSIDVKHSGKGTTPEEIVSAIHFLCSREAGKITGARIPLYR